MVEGKNLINEIWLFEKRYEPPLNQKTFFSEEVIFSDFMAKNCKKKWKVTFKDFPAKNFGKKFISGYLKKILVLFHNKIFFMDILTKGD